MHRIDARSSADLFREMAHTGRRPHLLENLRQPNKFRMEVMVPSWKQHLLQSERLTKTEKGDHR
jgi:hypothetical protein